MTSLPRPHDDGGRDPDVWLSRRVAGLALRLVVLVVPLLVAVATSFVVTRIVHAPKNFWPRTLWLAGVVAACGLLVVPARRVLRRLLPLAALLELAIRFPGAAPTRWKVARQAGTIRHLELLAAGVPDTEPVKAATTILALVASLSRHDRVTRGHSERVRVFTDVIAQEMALSRADRDRLRWAALIHDVGKLEVPGRLLRKPGKPSPQEWETLRLHPQVGARLAAPLNGWLGSFGAVVSQHHERFDGTGYPLGLAGEEISVGARIVGLADAFEVMTAARPYKRAMSR
ncbi:MAG TPA: HD domain-containing phosphohydrolase, partial [Acidothermaceae bacterium]